MFVCTPESVLTVRALRLPRRHCIDGNHTIVQVQELIASLANALSWPSTASEVPGSQRWCGLLISSLEKS